MSTSQAIQTLWDQLPERIQRSPKLQQMLQLLPEERHAPVLSAILQDSRGATKALRTGADTYEKGHLQRLWAEAAKPVDAVDAQTFLCDPYFLNRASEVYPKVAEEFTIINSGQYVEVVLTGAIGTAKTTLALWTTAYQLYLLSLRTNPQRDFQLESNSELLFIFQSLNATLAKALDFERFRHLLLGSPYFTEQFPFDKSLESELRFPNRLIVKPVSGADTAAIGQNVFGGILDEVNFMANVEDSKKSVDGGNYDQALALYNTISRRRKSRFMQQGKVPGIFCIVSSKRYPGQFTDVKEEEAKTDRTIYIYDKRTWDVLPPERFSGKWFKVFTGDLTRKARILEPGERVDPQDTELVLGVPEDYRTEFQSDMMNALRDIAGVSTLARHPFIMNNEAVAECFGVTQSVLTETTCDFVQQSLAILPKRFRNVEQPRFVHIDLGITGDAAGVACGHVPGFRTIEVSDDLVETLPIIEYDFTLRITPPRGDEIQFHKIRDLLYKLRDLGLPIKWVTLDSFQSRDMLQVLRAKGFVTGLVSVDTETTPYDTLKSALYQRRVRAPHHDFVERELISLERVVTKGKKAKVDHPSAGSKDIADAMAGVAYGLTMRREVWAAHGISLFELPQSIQTAAAKNDRRLKEDDGSNEPGTRLYRKGD